MSARKPTSAPAAPAGPVLHTALAVRPLEQLIPYARNSRTHTDAQVAQVAASIREFGFTNPVLVDESGGIIAGHARVLAARQLGMAEVPVLTLHGLSEAQRRAYVIADNRLALSAGWDPDLLRVEIQDLMAEGFDLQLTGFSQEELGDIMAPVEQEAPGLVDKDQAYAPGDVSVSVPGDVWLLGRHRIICGDSTHADTVAAVLAGVTPLLMVTDSPYGVEYDATWREDAAMAGGKPPSRKVKAAGAVANDDRADWGAAWALFPGDVAYTWTASLKAPEVVASLERCGFIPRALIIWAKPSLTISRGHYHWQHEPCWYAVRKGGTGHWNGDRKQSTLWTIHRDTNTTGHSTQKPVECMLRPMVNNSSPGQAVYDPFLGSGTTLIAGEMCGRQVLGVELNPLYVDVCCRRWQDFTGRPAIHEQTGQEFQAVAEGGR